jgi:transcriptional regulator
MILQLAQQGLSDYRIARKINTDPPSVTRSRKNAQKKLQDAKTDIAWAEKIGITSWEFEASKQKRLRSEWIELHFEALFFNQP